MISETIEPVAPSKPDPAEPLVPAPAAAGSALLGKPLPQLPQMWQWLLLVVALGGIGYLYSFLFIDLWAKWNARNSNYGHGPIVVVASIAFAVKAWFESGWPVRGDVDRASLTKGVTWIAIGLLVHMYCLVTWWLLVDVVSLLFVLRGLLMILGGEQSNEAYGFSVLFLIFMAPLPANWYDPVAQGMQWLAACASELGLDMLGIPVVRVGNTLLVPGCDRMEVGAACSGLRQLTAIVALAVAIGHLSTLSPKHKYILAFCSAPVAVASNCIRVLLTALIMKYVGAEYAKGLAHTMEGMVMVALSAVVILGLAWLLTRWEEQADEKKTPSPVAA